MAEADEQQNDPQQPDPKPDPKPAESKTFTEDQVNAIVQDRLARERSKQPSADELKELREKASQHDQHLEANASELEKAQAAREKAEALAATAIKQSQERILRSAIVAEAAKQGVTSTDAVVRALDKTGLTVADDGEVSGVGEAVTAFLTEFPAFVGKVAPKAADQGARGGGASDQLSHDALADMTPEQINSALREGKLNDLLKG